MAARLKLIKKVAKKVELKEKTQMKKVKKDLSHLTKQVKKAKHLAPSSLDAFSEKNLYWSEKETKDYLRGTDYINNYNAMKSYDEWN